MFLALLSALGMLATFGLGHYVGSPDAKKKKHFLKPPVMYIAIALAVFGVLASLFGHSLGRSFGMGRGGYNSYGGGMGY